jgi:hypothetical protein
MKKILSLIIAIFLLVPLTYAADDFQKEYQKAREATKKMRSQIKSGTIPVYVDVSCENSFIENRLTSLLNKSLREHKDVRIVGDREHASVWIRVLAIEIGNKRVAMSIVGGIDSRSYIDNPANLFSSDELTSHVIFVYPDNNLGQAINKAVATFDVECIEPIRKYIERNYSNP